jgi:plasmid maintenance system antidote protein VapI
MTPKGASGYIKKYLLTQKLSANQAAKILEVSQPTVTRFINGGALTPSMAAKINVAFGIGVETLFNLEAQVQVYKANQLMTA